MLGVPVVLVVRLGVVRSAGVPVALVVTGSAGNGAAGFGAMGVLRAVRTALPGARVGPVVLVLPVVWVVRLGVPVV